MATIPSIKIINNKKHIFCLIRRKWILFTPEEKVRQFTLQLLINEYHFPQKYISVEKTITVNELSKRYDIVVFNQQLQPKILIECKEETIELNEKTLRQIATYNLKLSVPFLVVTNGIQSFYFKIENETSSQIFVLPKFEDL
ncbi:MAG: type I restriction enzyme HsdR N-terminal domain-containing protein [Saprospirales bacterium]|nr:type I restriction enzyme HsdR N-terminal domain-containing protein [Saprospirales bacterium]